MRIRFEFSMWFREESSELESVDISGGSSIMDEDENNDDEEEMVRGSKKRVHTEKSPSPAAASPVETSTPSAAIETSTPPTAASIPPTMSPSSTVASTLLGASTLPAALHLLRRCHRGIPLSSLARPPVPIPSSVPLSQGVVNSRILILPTADSFHFHSFFLFKSVTIIILLYFLIIFLQNDSDLQTWISATVMNEDTCLDGLEEMQGSTTMKRVQKSQ
ncbi:hypothetical protein M9H77_35671 [Catharanthus roseus]|uniref:Uncharacterized protein n=1 Tax=Catharanthus roseus TaxID=4058 RepID=A0ACB9ZQX6_CATRO|nr:hypothetical protein M9H77_35671 [Catharanthus roseus]